MYYTKYMGRDNRRAKKAGRITCHVAHMVRGRSAEIEYSQFLLLPLRGDVSDDSIDSVYYCNCTAVVVSIILGYCFLFLVIG